MLKKTLLLLVTHGLTAGFAFAVGMYSLPILMAPPEPTSGALALTIKNTRYVATIAENLEDSDWLHWGKDHHVKRQVQTLERKSSQSLNPATEKGLHIHHVTPGNGIRNSYRQAV